LHATPRPPPHAVVRGVPPGQVPLQRRVVDGTTPCDSAASIPYTTVRQQPRCLRSLRLRLRALSSSSAPMGTLHDSMRFSTCVPHHTGCELLLTTVCWASGAERWHSPHYFTQHAYDHSAGIGRGMKRTTCTQNLPSSAFGVAPSRSSLAYCVMWMGEGGGVQCSRVMLFA